MREEMIKALLGSLAAEGAMGMLGPFPFRVDLDPDDDYEPKKRSWKPPEMIFMEAELRGKKMEVKALQGCVSQLRGEVVKQDENLKAAQEELEAAQEELRNAQEEQVSAQQKLYNTERQLSCLEQRNKNLYEEKRVLQEAWRRMVRLENAINDALTAAEESMGKKATRADLHGCLKKIREILANADNNGVPQNQKEETAAE